MLQEEQEPRQWLSLRATSLCLKGTQCRWSAAIRILGVLGSSGMSNTPNSTSSYSWNTPQERASRVSPLTSIGLRHPSIWKNPQLRRKTQLCITVLWVTQYLDSQEKQSANPLQKAIPCSLFDHSGALSLWRLTLNLPLRYRVVISCQLAVEFFLREFSLLTLYKLIFK